MTSLDRSFALVQSSLFDDSNLVGPVLVPVLDLRGQKPDQTGLLNTSYYQPQLAMADVLRNIYKAKLKEIQVEDLSLNDSIVVYAEHNKSAYLLQICFDKTDVDPD